MYTPKLNAETRVEVMDALVRAHPLGTWTLFDGDDLVTNHVPFLLDAERGPCGTLVGHVARANPVWRSPATAVRSVVAFQGPQAYVTPSWYASKFEDGKTVPTLNYAVVHARGVPTFLPTTVTGSTSTSRASPTRTMPPSPRRGRLPTRRTTAVRTRPGAFDLVLDAVHEPARLGGGALVSGRQLPCR